MALPVVAIIGRPNVGKSMFVNRLAGGRQAIVYDQPGVTRDRTYQPAFWNDRDFVVVDTGGLVFDDDTEFLPYIREQAMAALSEASAAIFVVDGKTGPTEGDQEIASWMRSQNVPVVLGVNKCESPDEASFRLHSSGSWAWVSRTRFLQFTGMAQASCSMRS